MSNKINVGILGCANIAKKYAIPAFKAIESVDNITIASRDAKKGQKCAEDFGIEFVGSYDALLDDPEIGAVYIPLPIGLHEEWVIKAASKGKHILCEKSLTHSFSSAKRIVEVCRKNDVVLFENFMCDFHPQHQKVSELLGKELGTPITFKGYFGFPQMDKNNFRYSRELGGGSLNDAGAYPVFVSRKFFGEPLSVVGTFEMENGVDMRGSAMLEFKDNVSALISFGFKNHYQNNYEIWGSNGLVKVKRAYSIPPDIKPEIGFWKNIDFKDVMTPIECTEANQFELSFDDFCSKVALNDTKKKKTMYDSILAQAKVLEAIRISANEDKKVNLSDV